MPIDTPLVSNTNELHYDAAAKVIPSPITFVQNSYIYNLKRDVARRMDEHIYKASVIDDINSLEISNDLLDCVAPLKKNVNKYPNEGLIDYLVVVKL